MDKFWLMSLVLYFLPTLSALIQQPIHHNWRAILVLNLLLGWTVIGWIVAMIWSYTRPAPATQRPPAETHQAAPASPRSFRIF